MQWQASEICSFVITTNQSKWRAGSSLHISHSSYTVAQCSKIIKKKLKKRHFLPLVYDFHNWLLNFFYKDNAYLWEIYVRIGLTVIVILFYVFLDLCELYSHIITVNSHGTFPSRIAMHRYNFVFIFLWLCYLTFHIKDYARYIQ